MQLSHEHKVLDEAPESGSNRVEIPDERRNLEDA